MNWNCMSHGTIGYSGENRPIKVIFIGAPTARCRVLVMAGQHGDEKLAIKAVKQFRKSHLRQDLKGRDLLIALLAEANPDGAAGGMRSNADGLDMNRDHQLLNAPETKALHQFIRNWQPHLVVDAHTYPSRRKHLLQENLIYCQDIFVDIPTNPNCVDGSFGALAQDLLETTISHLINKGYRCERYTLINQSGRVRHSTPDVQDARNGLALRYGIPTILLETRQPTRRDSLECRKRLQHALHSAIVRICCWADDNRDKFIASRDKISNAIIRSRYINAQRMREMDFKVLPSGEIKRMTLPGKYTPEVRATLKIDLPLAYAVPVHFEMLNDILGRHGFSYYTQMESTFQSVQNYHIDSVTESTRPHRMPRKISLHRNQEFRILDKHIIYPVTSEQGVALAILLEPQSKYGLSRIPKTGLTITANSVFPVLRVYNNLKDGVH